MSHSLLSLNNSVNLFKSLGLKTKEGLKFSLDSECLFLKGKVEVIAHKEEEVPSASGRSTKIIKVPQEVLFLPVVDITTEFMARANMSRLLCSPNPALFTLGKIQYPHIIEPLTQDKIVVNMLVNEGVSMEDLENLDHFIRIYVLV